MKELSSLGPSRTLIRPWAQFSFVRCWTEWDNGTGLRQAILATVKNIPVTS